MSATDDRRSDSSKSGFMLLARELRAAIYENVINSESAPPKGAENGSEQRSKQEFGMMEAFYPKEYRHACSSLLQTSKRIHDEVEATLDRLGRHPGQRCKLDLIVSEPIVWPTWILKPNPRCVVPCDLDVELRTVRDSRYWPLYMPHEPGLIEAPLMVLLNRILAYGPQLAGPHANFHGLKLHTLTLNIHHCLGEPVAFSTLWARLLRGPLQLKLEYAFGCLLNFMKRLENQGVLSGKVAEMKLVCKKLGRSPIVKVRDQGDITGVEEHWESLGFIWGLDPNACARKERSV